MKFHSATDGFLTHRPVSPRGRNRLERYGFDVQPDHRGTYVYRRRLAGDSGYNQSEVKPLRTPTLAAAPSDAVLKLALLFAGAVTVIALLLAALMYLLKHPV